MKSVLRAACALLVPLCVFLGPMGPARAAPIAVLQLGGSTAWNDGSYNITTTSTLVGQNFSLFDVVYISGAGGIFTSESANLAAFVSAGGGIVAESGGNISLPNFSWLPNGGGLTAVTQHQNTVVRTALGATHEVTASTTNAELSGWGNSQHNYFASTGSFDVLATNGTGQANILAGSFGSGLLVYLGVDPVCCHLIRPGAIELTRNAVTWSAGVSAVPVPAALPLFVSAIGIMGWLGRRRRAAGETA